MGVYSGRFDGRKAVVTGGASGIGFAIAERLASEGAIVTVWDRNPATAPANASMSVTVDITDFARVKDAADQTISAFGGIDILVNSAGITGPNLKTWDYPIDDWKQVFDVNVHGTFHCCKAIAPLMRNAGYGRIVNLASVAGKEGNANAPAYSASKAAVIGLTKSLGKELADTKVTVNCMTPAAVKTAIFDQMTPEFTAFMLSKIPMGRFGQVEEIAAMACWLASDECSFTTGGVFDISGGRATY